jgi:hypothetical protein
MEKTGRKGKKGKKGKKETPKGTGKGYQMRIK